MPHLRLTVAALALATTMACTPITNPAAPPSSPATSSGTSQCEPGWVCGTCPDGSTWGYLNDPQYTHDPRLSTLFFDNEHPCG